MQKVIYVLSILKCSLLFSQVGIGTSTPQGVLDIKSDDSGVIIPRNTDLGINIKSPVEGMIVYDQKEKKIKFYDGTSWNDVSKSASTVSSPNEGVVKINGFLNSSTEIKPQYTLYQFSAQRISYVGDLSFAPSPTTSWPANITNPTDSDIYDADNQTFVENNVLGQVTLWRIICTFKDKPAANTTGVSFKLRNSVSNFEQTQLVVIPDEWTDGSIVFNVMTIADDKSLQPPLGIGKGYEFWVTSDDPIGNFEITSITRVSLHKS